MTRRWDHRLTLLDAGPGFGKTTLMADANVENTLSPRGDDRWLTCDRGDAHPDRLAQALLHALDPDQQPPAVPADDPIRQARMVADAVWQRAPRHTCLFLDSVQELADVDVNGRAIELLAELVNILPTNGHLVLASRVALPLALTRYEVKGWICRIDERDLALDEAELAEFAALRGVPLAQLDGIGGWPALAELRALGHFGRVDDFLVEEVLSGFDDDERTLVATVAAIGGADRDLLAAVTGHEVDLPALLNKLPLACCDETGWCAIHPLWTTRLAEFLDPGERNRVRRDAGRRLVERDFLSGIELLVAAGDHDGIDSALRRSCRVHGLPTSATALDGLCRSLPSQLRQRPIGKLVKGIAMAASDVDRGVPYLEGVLRDFERADDEGGTLLAMENLALYYHWQEELKALADLVAGLDRLAHLTEAQGLIAVGRALVADTAGDALALLAAAQDAEDAELSDYWNAPIAWWCGTALLALGLPDAARKKAEVAIAEGSETFQGPYRMLLVSTLFLCGEVSTGLAVLDQMMAALEGGGNTHASLLGHCHAATHYALAGRAEQAHEHLGAARVCAGPTPSPSADAALRAAEIVVAVADGREARATELLRAQRDGRELGEGRRRYGELRRLPLQYVLEPSTREFWDQADVGPCYVLARDLARAITAIREEGDLAPAGALGPEHWLVAAGFVPANWRTELVVASAAVGDPSGGREAGKLRAADRPALRRVTSRRELPRAMRRWAGMLLETLPALPTVPIDVGVLGLTSLLRGGAPITHPHWRRHRVRLLLLLLIARGGGAREEIAGALWPDLDTGRAAHNLRVTLSYLLQVLEPEREEGEPSYFIRSEASAIHLVGDEWLRVDAWEFDSLIELADRAERQGEPSVALDHLTTAVGLYRGPYMADAGYENWALPHRDRLSARYVAAAVRAGELTLATGDTSRALILASRALEAEPYSEPAHCLAVAAHLSAGDRAAARRAMETCRRQLVDLGAAPSENVEILERALAVVT